jgi:hypothetical protein
LGAKGYRAPWIIRAFFSGGRNWPPATLISAYKDLLHMAEEVRGYALGAITVLISYPSEGEQIPLVSHLLEELKRAMGLLDRIMDQARRRVIFGEKVPASEKVVLFL